MRQVLIRFPEEIWEELEKFSKESGISKADVVRLAVTKLLKGVPVGKES